MSKVITVNIDDAPRGFKTYLKKMSKDGGYKGKLSPYIFEHLIKLVEQDKAQKA